VVQPTNFNPLEEPLMNTNNNNDTLQIKSALVVSDEPNFQATIKQLIKPFGWKVDAPFCRPADALGQLIETKASCLIIIDTVEYPASETLRMVRKDARGICTPTLLLLVSTRAQDPSLYSKIFKVHTAHKPITPNNFKPRFTEMISFWNQPALQALRSCILTTRENQSITIAILEKLLLAQEAATFALCAAVQLHIHAGNYAAAEAILIATFKKNPKSPAFLAICGWFYLEAKMPEQALLFLNKLKLLSPDSTLLNLDIAAANLAISNYSGALAVLTEWNDRNPGNSTMNNFVARMLLAEGRIESMNEMAISPSLLRKFAAQWDAASNLAPKTAGAPTMNADLNLMASPDLTSDKRSAS
jgi:tetratricopeptide (TPR) repeat protein